MFGRKAPEINMKLRDPAESQILRDDEIHMVRFQAPLISFLIFKFSGIQNTQSGTQWDGLRHFGIIEHGVFYNK